MMQVKSSSFLEFCWLHHHTTSKSNKWTSSQLFSPISWIMKFIWNSLKDLPIGRIKFASWRSIYGLKQSPRLWNKRLDECLKEIGFDQTHSDHCVYINKSTGVIVAIGGDDLIIFGKDSV